MISLSLDTLHQQPASARNPSLRILVVRCDRLGDVILSTPVFDVLKRHNTRTVVTAMVKPAIAPVIRGLASVDNVVIYEPEGRHRGVRGFFRLVSEIRRGGFGVAIVLQTQFKLAAAVFAAGIRYRIGPLSKVHSYLFYNKGVRQRRSQVEMHETDYNLQLLMRLGIRVGTRNVPVSAAISGQARLRAREWLLSQGWEAAQPLVAVHPGMGGSALNWPEAHYIDLVAALLREGRHVLLTAGPAEGDLLARIRKALELKAGYATWTGRLILSSSSVTRTVEELGALLAHASVVVAPSTGPLHLAVATGRPVVTFYPPIRVQSAIRWGPYLRDESRASVLVPDVYCGQDFKCRGSECHYFPCMKGLTVNQALEQVAYQLAHADAPAAVAPGPVPPGLVPVEGALASEFLAAEAFPEKKT